MSNGKATHLPLSSSLPSFSPFLTRRPMRGRANSEPQKLIAMGDEINSRNEKGQSLLFYAIRFGYENFAKELLEKGCDPNGCDNVNHYPIHEAVDQSDDGMILLLKKYGADMNVRNLLGQTPLMRAVLFDDVHMVKTLIEAGANPNQKDITGQTVFELALNTARENTCIYLLQNGYDVKTKDAIFDIHLRSSSLSSSVVNSISNFVTCMRKRKLKIQQKLNERKTVIPTKMGRKAKDIKRNISCLIGGKRKHQQVTIHQDSGLPSFSILEIH